jgi:hypothetical protein
MILQQILTYVSNSCIYTSYASRHSCSTGAAPQSLPNPASSLFLTLRGGSTARQIVLHFSASGLSISQAGGTLKASRSDPPPQDCLHRQTAAHADPPTAHLRCSQSTHLERHGQSRLDRNARSRTEAWLNRGQPGAARCIWNISSIAYWILSSSKPTNCCCPISCGPHMTLRR